MTKKLKSKLPEALVVSFGLLLFGQSHRISFISETDESETAAVSTIAVSKLKAPKLAVQNLAEPLRLAVPSALAQSSQDAQKPSQNTQHSKANPQQNFYEIKLLQRAHQKKLEEENVARIKELLKLDSKSFLETWRRRDLDPVTFIQEAANRGNLYLACGDTYSAYSLYKEAVRSLKRFPSTDGTGRADSQNIEGPLWQLLLNYLKTTVRESDEREAIHRIMNASDRPGAVPYVSGASNVAEYFIGSGRRKNAIDLLDCVLAMILKNKPADNENLCAASYEFERINSLNRMPAAAKRIKEVEQAWIKVLDAAKKHHAEDRAILIEPMAHLSGFYIRYDDRSKGDKLAEQALKLAAAKEGNCILDRLYLISEAYLERNEIEKADEFLRTIAQIKCNQFKRTEFCYLPNSYRQLKTRYEERGQWSKAEALLELFRQAQEPGTYAELCVLQDLMLGEMEEAASLHKQGKKEEADRLLNKSDQAYLKVRQYYLGNNDKSLFESVSQNRKERLRSLGLENNLEY